MVVPDNRRKSDTFEDHADWKRRRTVSMDVEKLLSEPIHDQVQPPDNMDWLVQQIAANGGRSLFKLDADFVRQFEGVDPPFGFNGLGEMVYQRTYSRMKPDGTNEKWLDTILRVVEGVYEVQKAYVLGVLRTEWDDCKAQQSAQEMFERMFFMKFLPPGRGLWAMGTDIIRAKGLGAALNNCAFVSTEDIAARPTEPFTFLMDAAMLGVGVGFDTAGAGKIQIKEPCQPAVPHVVGDTREGWVEATTLLLNSFFIEGAHEVTLDYSHVRPAGMALKTFGGVSSGPGPLIDLHTRLTALLKPCVGKHITVTNIVDIMNLIGKCVVAGNVRRTAEIAFGSPHSAEFLDLKNYEANPHRSEFGWTSNNSIFAEIGMDYKEASARIQMNGEPGFAWLNNMQAFSRMKGRADYRDEKVKGGNPCLEQSLESHELCCLVETFPFRHDNLEDFKRTLRFAHMYAKTVTLIAVHWPATREVMFRNRRIGCSVSGVAQFITARGLHTLRTWLEEGYSEVVKADRCVSTWWAVPRSVKLTSVKPSGTISLLAGATPGIHYPEARFYIRRIRMNKDFPMLQKLREAGYHVEPAVGSESTTVVVEVPVDVGAGIRGVAEVSMWEQLALAAFMQRHWADNQVSATVTFDPAIEGPQIEHALQYYQYQLKGISLLPRHEYGAFPQMPYEKINEERYLQEAGKLCALKRQNSDMPPRTCSTILRSTMEQAEITHKEEDAFCDGDKCEYTPLNRSTK